MPVTETKLYAAQEKILRLIAADGRPVLPNDLAMRSICRELCYIGWLTRHGFILMDDEGGMRIAQAYSVSLEGWKILGGGK